MKRSIWMVSAGLLLGAVIGWSQFPMGTPGGGGMPFGPQAPEGPGGFPGGFPGGMPMPSAPLVDALDTNGDGVIDAAEIEAAGASLLTLDRDKDGRLSRDEFGLAFPMGGPGGFPGGPGGMGQDREVVKDYDTDGDGRLNDEERATARAALESAAAEGGRRGGFMPFGPGGPGRPGGGAVEVAERARVKPEDVEAFGDRELYDPTIVRTLFLTFPNDDWELELETFYRTDVEVPATLSVDGKSYPDVGVHFRGNTSYMMAQRGTKRPLNISIDDVHKGQNLLGYRTLNLLNAAGDPSLMREYLYYEFSRRFVPALKVNHVRLVINGEDWGVYVNSQQFNKDSVEEMFGERNGARWKVPANLSGSSSLLYTSDQVEDYRDKYELKSKEDPRAWNDLIALCRALQETPIERQEEELGRMLDLDEVLKFLALENVMMDEDGYVTRGSDFYIYQEARNGRFHLIAHDNNETFKQGGMMGPGGFGERGRGRRGFGGGGGGGGAMPAVESTALPVPGVDDETIVYNGWDPLRGADNPQRPLLNRLLANPTLKARYLEHRQAILDEIGSGRGGPRPEA
ncbi:MAG: CotH kinase family protein [Verrucomicrobiota bacterium]|nr:CotH kinase family protein [Verrucomicrobiota bacterium]